MNGIIYARVSTTEQDFQRQIEDLRELCKKKDITVLKEFVEKETGTKRERKELTAMMKFVEDSTDLDFVVIHELSRLGRTNKVLETIEELNKRKICLISKKENLETLDSEKNVNSATTFMLIVLSGISTLEIDTLKYRIKSGIKSSRKKGNAAGGLNIPYGYMKKNDKQLTPDWKDEAQTIKKIFNLYLNGKDGEDFGTRKIAIELINSEPPILTRTQKIIDSGKNVHHYIDEEGNPQIKLSHNFGTQWNESSIYQILTNPIYCGKRRSSISNVGIKYDYELLPQPQLQIIKPEVFEAVQKKLSNNVTKIDINRKFFHLLDNKKVFCGCGENMFAYSKSDKLDELGNVLKKGENSFKCNNKIKINGKCNNDGINIDKVDRLVQSVILYKYSDIMLKNLDNKQLKQDIIIIETEIETLNKQLKKEEAKEKNLVLRNIDGRISDNVFDDMFNNIKKQEERLKNMITFKENRLDNLNREYSNQLDISKLKYKFNIKNEKLPKVIVNTILTSLTLTALKNSPAKFQDIIEKVKKHTINNKYLFNKLSDRLLLATFKSGVIELHYLVSQREDYVYDFQDEKIRPLKDIDTLVKATYKSSNILTQKKKSKETISNNLVFEVMAIPLYKEEKKSDFIDKMHKIDFINDIVDVEEDLYIESDDKKKDILKEEIENAIEYKRISDSF
jgi:DNA invertase Pin-like site-specific DNA recombinase